MRADEMVTALAALAHEHRIAIFRLLVQASPLGLPAGIIADRLALAPSSLSFHIKTLVEAGLATRLRDGRQLIYAGDFARMNSLIESLTANCCGGISCTPPRPAAGNDADGRPA